MLSTRQQSTGATSGAGTAYPSIAPEFTADFCVVFYRLLFVQRPCELLPSLGVRRRTS